MDRPLSISCLIINICSIIIVKEIDYCALTVHIVTKVKVSSEQLSVIYVCLLLHRNISCDLSVKQGMLLYVQYLLKMPCVRSMMAFEDKSIPESKH